MDAEARSRLVALGVIREACLRELGRAQRAGEQIDARVRQWVDGVRSKRAREAAIDGVLVEIARELLVDPDAMKVDGKLTDKEMEAAPDFDPFNLTAPIPAWYEAIYERTKTFDYRMATRVEEYFMPWLESAQKYGIDLAQTNGAEAFVQVRVERARELGGTLDPEAVREEIDSSRSESLLARSAYGLGTVIAKWITEGKEPVAGRDWWQVGVATLVALDPLVDARVLGLTCIPSLADSDDQDFFGHRKLISQYADVRQDPGVTDRREVWRLARLAALSMAPEDASHDAGASSDPIAPEPSEPVPLPGRPEEDGSPDPEDEPPREEPPPMLRRDGKVWTIRFGGVVKIMPHLIGLGYIQRLVMRPNKQISVLELKAGVGGPIPSTVDDEVMDDRAIEETRDSIEDLRGQVQEAKDAGRIEEAEELQSQLDRTKEFLENALNVKGESRRLGSDVETARNSVGGAIHYALAQMKTAHEQAFAHLDKAIVNAKGANPSYVPRDKTEWLT